MTVVPLFVFATQASWPSEEKERHTEFGLQARQLSMTYSGVEPGFLGRLHAPVQVVDSQQHKGTDERGDPSGALGFIVVAHCP